MAAGLACACALVRVAPIRLTRAKAHWPPKASFVGRGSSGSGVGCAAVTEPEALAVHFEDVDVVGQAVEDGAGQAASRRALPPMTC
jgi:hypothetical protein